MEVHVQPTAVLSLPNAGFHAADCGWRAGRINPLHQTRITDNRCIRAEHLHVRAGHSGGPRLRAGAQVEVELMERQADDKMPTGLRLEAGQLWMAERFVGSPVG